MDVGFKRIKWFQSRSAYQDMQYRRQRRAEAIKKHLEMSEAVNAALSGAQQDKISGLSTLAAQAALKRIQDLAKTTSANITKKIDSAQSVINAAQASSTSSTSNSNMLDTVV